jgi:hypothetical protein
MHPAVTVAFCSYSLAALLSLSVGTRYLLRREFMPYHGQAAGVQWTELPPGLRVLTLGLLHGVGGGFLAVGISVIVLLVFPFRAGDAWAQWAIPAIGLALGIPVLVGVHRIRTHTPAQPPWALTVLAVGLFVVGAAAALMAHLG